MATEQLSIFLSASIPMPDRDPKYFETADVIAIRDSVMALTTLLLPNYKLVWGGHPSITALIAHVLDHLDKKANEYVTLYQSKYFEQFFPLENESVAHIVITPNLEDRDSSLEEMRNQMLQGTQFNAAFFIGGMEGVELEFEMFTNNHPEAKVFPVASTGAAAKIIYDKAQGKYDPRLLTEMTYTSLFKELLQNI